MTPRTWETVLAEIQAEMDVEDENFITPTELMAAANVGIRRVQAGIVGIWDGYLRKPYEFTLVAGTTKYTLPTDMYAQRIDYIYFDDGNDKSGIPKGEPWECIVAEDNDKYFYDIENNTWNTGRDIVFYGLPTFTSAHTIKMWYIREITRITSINSYVNIPEFENVIMLYVKKRIAEKEKNPLLPLIVQELKEESALMLDSIRNQKPHGVNLEPDMSFYDDMIGGTRL